MIAARVKRGAISRNSSSHLPPIAPSSLMKPVTLPPGRARLPTKPAPTGSETTAKTTGIVRVSFASAAVTGVVPASITSGRRSTNSFAKVCALSTLALVQRMSIRRLRPSTQPNSASPCKNATSHVRYSGTSSDQPSRTPIRRIVSICCARAASGHAAAPPIKVMNLRRCI